MGCDRDCVLLDDTYHGRGSLLLPDGIQAVWIKGIGLSVGDIGSFGIRVLVLVALFLLDLHLIVLRPVLL